MDNTLQVRISADISALQSALTKAKNTIKSFESETEKESEKGNVGFKRKIGLIEQLTNKAKALRTALFQATNEQQVERFNKELEQTSRELTRLNALGRSVTANLGSTASGFGQVATKGANANGVALEFNRIIQDAPFGLIGIGNNLQQLAGNFSQVSKQAGGTGKAIAASFSSIVSPVNLGLLAISALTAGFTAYQMGAFDSIIATDSATESLEDYRDSLDAVTRSSIEGAAQGQSEVQAFQLLKAQAENANIPLKARLEAVKELQTTFPDYLGNLTQEQILTGNVGTAYEDLTAQIIATAKARAASDLIAENSLKILTLEEQQLERANKILEKRDEFAKARESVYDVGEIEIIKEINDLSQEQVDGRNEINRLKTEEENLTGKINEQISKGARFTEDQKQKVIELNSEAEKVKRTYEELNSSIDDILERASLERRDAFFTGVEAPISVESGAATTQGIIIPDLGTEVFKEQAQEVIDTNRIITDSFSSLGTAIAANLDISNDAVKGFVSTVLSNAPKLIQAIIAQAQASNRAADIANQGNIKQATGNAIVTATSAAKGLGPIGLAALPIFIGGVLALISGAFGKSAGGGGSASVGSASAGAPPQIFTNSQIPSIPGSSAPSPSGNIDFDREQGRITTTVSGEDIVFVYDRYQERKKGGG